MGHGIPAGMETCVLCLRVVNSRKFIGKDELDSLTYGTQFRSFKMYSDYCITTSNISELRFRKLLLSIRKKALRCLFLAFLFFKSIYRVSFSGSLLISELIVISKKLIQSLAALKKCNITHDRSSVSIPFLLG